MSLSHIALAIFVTTLWGFTFVVMRDLLDTLPPFLMSTLRVVAAGASRCTGYCCSAALRA
mgnify:CR=1 FL=1